MNKLKLSDAERQRIWRENNRIKLICRYCHEEFWGLRDQIFCDQDCTKSYQKGENSPNYKTGTTKMKDGYVKELCHGHPRADGNGYVFQHILVAEQKYGKAITVNEVVHHINRIRDDNRPENLYLFSSKELHQRFHKEFNINPDLTPEEFMSNN